MIDCRNFFDEPLKNDIRAYKNIREIATGKGDDYKMTVTKNSDPNKYGDNGYGIGFDVCSQFSLPIGEWGKDVLFLMYIIIHQRIPIMEKKNILCNGCHDLLQKSMSFNDVAIANIRRIDHRIYFENITKG